MIDRSEHWKLPDGVRRRSDTPWAHDVPCALGYCWPVVVTLWRNLNGWSESLGVFQRRVIWFERTVYLRRLFHCVIFNCVAFCFVLLLCPLLSIVNAVQRWHGKATMLKMAQSTQNVFTMCSPCVSYICHVSTICLPCVYHVFYRVFFLCFKCVYKVFTMYFTKCLSCVWHVFTKCIPCIYHVYHVFTMCLPCDYHVFTKCLPCQPCVSSVVTMCLGLLCVCNV